MEENVELDFEDKSNDSQLLGILAAVCAIIITLGNVL